VQISWIMSLLTGLISGRLFFFSLYIIIIILTNEFEGESCLIMKRSAKRHCLSIIFFRDIFKSPMMFLIGHIQCFTSCLLHMQWWYNLINSVPQQIIQHLYNVLSNFVFTNVRNQHANVITQLHLVKWQILCTNARENITSQPCITQIPHFMTACVTLA